jgi:hypothetical protein
VTLTLDAPATAKLRAEPTTVPQEKQSVKLLVAAPKETPVGATGATIRGEAVVEGLTIEVAVALPLTIAKP